MSTPFLPIAKPVMGEEEVEAVRSVLESGFRVMAYPRTMLRRRSGSERPLSRASR